MPPPTQPTGPVPSAPASIARSTVGVLSPQVSLALYFLIAFSALGLYLPYFPTWLTARGFRGTTMSAVAMLLPTMAIVAPPAFGMLADALSLRGSLLRIAGFGATIGFTALAFVAATQSNLPFSAAFVCVGIFALFRTPMLGIADVIALEEARDYGRVRLWGSLGFLIAAWAGGHLVDPQHPYQLPVCIAVALAAATAMGFVLPRTSKLPPRPVGREVRILLGRRDFRWFLLGSFLILGAHSAYDLCATLRFFDLGATGAEVGLAWAIGTGAEILLMAVAPPFLRRIGAAPLLCLSYSTSVVRWLLFSVVDDVSTMLLFQPLHALSFGLMWVAANAVLKETVMPAFVDGTARERLGMGTAQGLFAACNAAGGATGMAIWGGLYDSGGGPLVFLAAAFVAGGATLVGLMILRSTRRWALEGRPA